MTIKVAAIGDIHVRETSVGAYKPLFEEISERADVLVLCGDLTDHGLPSEAEILADELRACRIPVVGVLGNHDFESGKEQEVASILSRAKMFVLDAESTVVEGVGFAGVKGFAGGFDTFILSPFGEPAIKAFVDEALNESFKLEEALKELHTEKKVVALHYAPIRETILNEPEEIFPYLGSSRLLVPIEQFQANVVFHGHAHHGTHKGQSERGTPVYNVAYQLMQKENPEQPYALIEV